MECYVLIDLRYLCVMLVFSYLPQYLALRMPISKPHCLDDMCACTNGYNFHDDRKICVLNYIAFPATGKFAITYSV